MLITTLKAMYQARLPSGFSRFLCRAVAVVAVVAKPQRRADCLLSRLAWELRCGAVCPGCLSSYLES